MERPPPPTHTDCLPSCPLGGATEPKSPVEEQTLPSPIFLLTALFLFLLFVHAVNSPFPLIISVILELLELLVSFLAL